MAATEPTLDRDGCRIHVLDLGGDSLPTAVAVQETPDGGRFGFPADVEGWIDFPSNAAGAVTTVMAAGYIPEVLHGVRRGERVLLARAIRVQVEVTDGWQRLTEGVPGTRIEGEFRAKLEPAAQDIFADAPTVGVQLSDGSESQVDLADLQSVLDASVSPGGLVTFWVVDPGAYGVQIVWCMKRPREPDRSSVCTVHAEPWEIVVRPDEKDQYFQIRIPSRILDQVWDLMSRELGD